MTIVVYWDVKQQQNKISGHYSYFIEDLQKLLANNKDHVKSPHLQSLRERLCTHKVFTKDHCFYLNYHMFSIKSYVVDVY